MGRDSWGVDTGRDSIAVEGQTEQHKESRFAKMTNPSMVDRQMGENTGNLVNYVNVPQTVGQFSKALGSNPKDLYGTKKVSFTKLPAVAIAHAAHAMMDGARKYGPYNWRANKVIASIYIDAAIRHLLSWFDEREETASDSGVHHLGHAIACASILLDAQATGNLIDDRPNDGKLVQILNQLAEKIKQKAQELENAQGQAVNDHNPTSQGQSGSYTKIQR